MALLEQPPDFFEDAPLARNIQVEQDVVGREQFGDGIHGWDTHRLVGHGTLPNASPGAPSARSS
jgi:hypothetical protein